MTNDTDLRGHRRFLRYVTHIFGTVPLLGRWSRATATDIKVSRGKLPFDYEIVPGAEAADRISELRKRESCVPVVLGEPSRLATLASLLRSNGSFDETKRKGLALDVDKWIRDRRASDPDYYIADGPLTGVEPVEPLTSVRDVLSGTYLPKVAIALCRVTEPWEVAAVLRPGGWNDCPDSTVHLAFFKRWYELYGAVVTSMTDDVIEFTIAHPPKSPQQAMRLAEEQFVYCADIVHQGVNSIRNLAAILTSANNWYFWWD